MTYITIMTLFHDLYYYDYSNISHEVNLFSFTLFLFGARGLAMLVAPTNRRLPEIRFTSLSYFDRIIADWYYYRFIDN